MRKLTRYILRVILLLNLAACSETATVTGSAYYRERIALPPIATFEALLFNCSIADTIVTPIGQVIIENMTGVPIEFSIPYDPLQIDDRLCYSVRATIRVEDRLWFTTDTHYPVLTNSHASRVKMLLIRVGHQGAEKNRFLATFGTFPASYAGLLPCADCPGIHYVLNLATDHGFKLNLRYIDRENRVYTTGQWLLSDNGDRLTLQSTEKPPVYFTVVDYDTLRMLDTKGRKIESTLNYELQRFATD